MDSLRPGKRGASRVADSSRGSAIGTRTHSAMAWMAKAQKLQRHRPLSAKKPPISGPQKADTPQTADMMPISRGQCRSG